MLDGKQMAIAEVLRDVPLAAKSQTTKERGTECMFTEPNSKTDRPPRWWTATGYTAAILPLVFLIGSVWVRPDLNRQEPPDWKPVLAHAEASREKGDLYAARGLYSQAGRLASWGEDWAGLLAAACGMKKLDSKNGSYFNTHTLLVRALMAAETTQSRAGIAAVANAFTGIGEHKAASMVLSRIQNGWPEAMEDSYRSDAGDCWEPNTMVHSASSSVALE